MPVSRQDDGRIINTATQTQRKAKMETWGQHDSNKKLKSSKHRPKPEPQNCKQLLRRKRALKDKNAQALSRSPSDKKARQQHPMVLYACCSKVLQTLRVEPLQHPISHPQVKWRRLWWPRHLHSFQQRPAWDSVKRHGKATRSHTGSRVYWGPGNNIAFRAKPLLTRA